MDEGGLCIENWRTEIGMIQIQPILDKIPLEEELRLIIEIYEEDNDEFEFDFNLSHIKIAKEINLDIPNNDEIEFSESEIGFNEILYLGEEFEIKKLRLKFSFESEKRFLFGEGKAENENHEIKFEFKGEYEIKELEVQQLSNKSKRERQQRNPNELILVLEQIANKSECERYKNSVPFVHIPNELISQWEGAYQPNSKWYDQFYEESEKNSLMKFNHLLKQIDQDNEYDLPDVPEIFDLIKWQNIMNEANQLANEIKTLWNK